MPKRSAKYPSGLQKKLTRARVAIPRSHPQVHVTCPNLLREKVLCLKLRRVDDPQLLNRGTKRKIPVASEVDKTGKRISQDLMKLCPKRLVIKLRRATIADNLPMTSVQKMAAPKVSIRRGGRHI